MMGTADQLVLFQLFPFRVTYPSLKLYKNLEHVYKCVGSLSMEIGREVISHFEHMIVHDYKELFCKEADMVDIGIAIASCKAMCFCVQMVILLCFHKEAKHNPICSFYMCR